MLSFSKFISRHFLPIQSLRSCQHFMLLTIPFRSFSTSLAYKNTENSIFGKRQKRKPDRFGINKIMSIEKLIDLFQTPKYTLTLNETILICHQITQLAPIHVLKSIYGLSEILPKIQMLIGDVNLIEEDPLVGSLLISLNTLKCYKNIDHWIHLLDLIMADCFDPEADEILKAMMGCDGLERHLLEDWQKQLFDSAFLKIEMLLVENLKQMKYNWDNLGDICRILIKNDRINEEVFEEIDFQVMKYIKGERKTPENEEIEIRLEELINFSYYFALADHYSPFIFPHTNNILLEEIKKKSASKAFDALTGSTFANLMHAWNFSKQKESFFEIDETIREWALKNSIDSRLNYNIEDLISIHSALPLLEVGGEKLGLIRNHLEKKLLGIDTTSISNLNLFLIEKYFKLRSEAEHNNDYNQFPIEVYRFFDVLCSQIYERFHYDSVNGFFHMLEDNHILNRFPNFFSILPKFIEKHAFNYEFDDVCYFYLLFISNTSLLNEDKSGEFYNALNNIKEFVKFVALRRGFKMDMDSNFHKLLSAIDLAHFFEGGEG